MKPGLFESVDAVGAGLSRRTMGTALLGAGLLAGCGFQLRGSQSFNFSSIAVTPNPGGAVADALRRALADAVRVLAADAPVAQAQVVLQVVSEAREKVVVGVNSSGQVRELQLRLRVKFRLTSARGQELIVGDEIVQQRDISYNESAALAKETEEGLLYRDMQSDIVQQILRRLAAVKPTL
jgi:LPS-assembly lipoprotein